MRRIKAEQPRKMLNLFDSKISSSNDLHPLIIARQKRIFVRKKKKKQWKHN